MRTEALREVSKVYGSGPSEVRGLSAVDLLVECGELVAIMGPSGSGKSTLLTIAGSLSCSGNSGHVGDEYERLLRDETLVLQLHRPDPRFGQQQPGVVVSERKRRTLRAGPP